MLALSAGLVEVVVVSDVPAEEARPSYVWIELEIEQFDSTPIPSGLDRSASNENGRARLFEATSTASVARPATLGCERSARPAS